MPYPIKRNRKINKYSTKRQKDEQAYQEGEKDTLEAIEQMEKEITRLREGLHMCKELAMLRDNYGMIESVAQDVLDGKE